MRRDRMFNFGPDSLADVTKRHVDQLAAAIDAGMPWPPQSGVRPVRQENKLLIATAFSPVR